MVKETIYSIPRTGTVDFGTLITTPTGFDPAKESLPLIVFLHGMGERGNDIEKVKVHGIPKLFSADPDYKGLRVVTVSPQCPETTVWNYVPDELIHLVERVIAEYNIDRDRVSLTGLSMGGYGTWELGSRYPEYFSALAPICGGASCEHLGSLSNKPVRVFHSDDDPVVPFSESERAVEALKARGGHPEFTVYHGCGHGSWVAAYEQSDLIEWLVAQKRAK